MRRISRRAMILSAQAGRKYFQARVLVAMDTSIMRQPRSNRYSRRWLSEEFLVREIMPVPVHFHGDGKFLNGNIQIVGTDSFLSDEFRHHVEPAKRQERGSVRLASCNVASMQYAHGVPEIFSGSLAPALGDVCFGCDGTLLAYGHSGCSEVQGTKPGFAQYFQRKR